MRDVLLEAERKNTETEERLDQVTQDYTKLDKEHSDLKTELAHTVKENEVSLQGLLEEKQRFELEVDSLNAKLGMTEEEKAEHVRAKELEAKQAILELQSQLDNAEVEAKKKESESHAHWHKIKGRGPLIIPSGLDHDSTLAVIPTLTLILILT